MDEKLEMAGEFIFGPPLLANSPKRSNHEMEKSGGKVQGFLLCLALARERVCMNEALAIERCRSSIQQL